MSSTNTPLVREYLDVLWNQGRTELGERYVAEELIQHNPNLPDGRKPLLEYIEGARKQMPEMRFDIKRTAAEGDLVFVHSLFVPSPGQRGIAVIDVFRVEDGLIVEHWDLNEPVPETTASGREIV